MAAWGWAWFGLAALAVLLTPAAPHSIKEHMFWSDVHLEHFYILEENVLSHADILLRDNYFGAEDGEEAEAHAAHAPNLTEFHTIIDETKAIHREAGPKLQAYLSNPINVYHLIHRLHARWSRALELLLKTTPCKHWGIRPMQQRLMYMQQQLPGVREMHWVVHFTSMLQRIHGLAARDLGMGQLGAGVTPAAPLSVDEMYSFSKILRDDEDMANALDWLKTVNLKLEAGEAAARTNRSQVLVQMGSTYYSLKNYKEAVKVTEEALKLDPTSSSAKRNLGFFKNKAESNPGKLKPPSQFKNKYERTCAKPRLTRKKCFYSTILGLPMLKTEVVRRKPQVVLFHDVISEKAADLIKNHAFKEQADKAWIGDERYVVPDFRLSVHPRRMSGASRHVKAAAQTWVGRLGEIAKDVLDIKMMRWGSPAAVNLGLDGMHLAQHDKDLGVVKPLHGNTGVFWTYLSGDHHKGGDAAFGQWGTSVQPTKGSVMFYYTSKVVAHSHCPTIGESLWMVVQPIYEAPRDTCSPDDEWL